MFETFHINITPSIASKMWNMCFIHAIHVFVVVNAVAVAILTVLNQSNNHIHKINKWKKRYFRYEFMGKCVCVPLQWKDLRSKFCYDSMNCQCLYIYFVIWLIWRLISVLSSIKILKISIFLNPPPPRAVNKAI